MISIAIDSTTPDQTTVTSKAQLKAWFINGAKPNQAQFYAWMDSYWHKSEYIPAGYIKGLGELLGIKADAEQLQYLANKDGSNIAENRANWLSALNLSAVYKIQASAETFEDLPAEGNETGDVRRVNESGEKYVWTGDYWDKLVEIPSVQLPREIDDQPTIDAILAADYSAGVADLGGISPGGGTGGVVAGKIGDGLGGSETGTESRQTVNPGDAYFDGIYLYLGVGTDKVARLQPARK